MSILFEDWRKTQLETLNIFNFLIEQNVEVNMVSKERTCVYEREIYTERFSWRMSKYLLYV